MTILPNGNVGIGTTNPSKKLHIQGNGGGSAGIQFSSTNSSGAGYMYIQRNTDGKAFVLNQSNHAMILGANNRYDSLRGGPQLYLKETGNIGIGTDSPTYKLEIYTEEANTYHNDGNVAHDNGFTYMDQLIIMVDVLFLRIECKKQVILLVLHYLEI